MNKICPNCNKEVNDNANYCLNCGKKLEEKKEFIKKGKDISIGVLLLIIILIIGTFAALFLLFTVGFKKVESTILNEYIENFPVIREGTINDTLKYEDLSITLKSSKIYDSLQIGETKMTPSNNHKYLVLDFSVKNNSNQDKLLKIDNFIGFVDSKMISKININNEKYLTTDQTISSNETLEGYILYEINSNWSKFELEYGLDSNKIRFKITSPEVNTSSNINSF